MFHHARIEQQTGLKIYFADPHSPWQRAANENTNGLLRQYFLKGTDLNTWTAAHLHSVAAELNDRPPMPRVTGHQTKPCDDGHVSKYDDDSRRSPETARSAWCC